MRGRCRRSRRMRCSANGASLRHKATFFALKTVPLRVTYTSSPPAGGASPQRGSQRGIVPRGAQNKRLLPRIQKLSPLCTTSLSLPPPVAPVPRGVSGGGAALSPGFQLNLCSLPKHGAHSAAQSPECAFLRRFRVSGFCLRSFAQAKNGVNLRRRSHKISVTKAKTA